MGSHCMCYKHDCLYAEYSFLHFGVSFIFKALSANRTPELNTCVALRHVLYSCTCVTMCLTFYCVGLWDVGGARMQM